jgi:hypothetical protein
VNVEDVHRHMWSLVDDRHRVQIQIVDLVEVFEVHRDIMNEALLEMRGTGRIKFVACRAGKLYVYEVSNPNTFTPGDPRTHLARPRQPAWG